MAAEVLTDQGVQKEKTTAPQKDIPDAKVRGLQLRVTRQGTKTWAIRYTRQSDGRLRRLTLGTFPAISLAEARKLAVGHLAAVARGDDPAGAAQRRKEAETFGEVADDWLERHAVPNKSPRAVVDDRSMLARHILPEIGAMKAVEVKKRDVIRLLDAVATKADARLGRNGRAVASGHPRRLTHRPNRVFELVRSIFRWAVSRDIISADPTSGIKPPIKVEAPRRRTLRPAEIARLWSALERAPLARRVGKGVARGEKIVGEADIPFTRPTALAMMLALVTAQRIGEIAGIARAELSFNDVAPFWEIPGERTKNRQPHRVPLSPLAVRLILEAMSLAGDSEWLFPGANGAKKAIDPHAPTKALERARDAIGIAHFRIHDLRRTAATLMAEMRISPHTISHILNHISVTKGTITSEVYNLHSYEDEKREALTAWGARLERIIAGDERANVVPIAAALQAN